ncbi:MAG TPA: class I SAM-dependent methyltransferase [Leptolyngbyaceae cyanobacterium]
MSNRQRLIWFLKHPKLYPEAIRRANRKIKSILFNEPATYTAKARAKAQAEATEWCEKYAIDTQTAILKITGLAEFKSFYSQFQKQIKLAEEIVEKCPVKMGGAGNLELIYQISEYLQAKQVIETGVSYGWSSLALLMSLKNRQNSLLVSTDLPYLFENSEKYVGCVIPQELKHFWKLLPYADKEALPEALSLLPTIDIAHYDSDKFYEGRLWAYPQLWEALRPGGIFISDDVHDDFAFRDFCNSINQEPLIVKTPLESGAKYVGLLTKPKN